MKKSPKNVLFSPKNILKHKPKNAKTKKLPMNT